MNVYRETVGNIAYILPKWGDICIVYMKELYEMPKPVLKDRFINKIKEI